MISIRARTATLVALSMTTLLAVGAVVLLFVLRRAMTAQFDDALSARAAALQSLTRYDGVKVELDFAGEAMPRFSRVAQPEFFVVWTRESAGWRVLERSESLQPDRWPDATALDAPAGIRNLPLPDGGRGRAAIIEFPASPERDEEAEHRASASERGPSTDPPPTDPLRPTVRILVALSRAPLDRTLATLGWSIAGFGTALALASIAASRWAVSRGLLPLDALSRRVQALGPETLRARFDAAGLPAELRPIANQLNALLARLQEAFDREKRFSAAASHELRTPIAELRTLLDVASSRPRTSTEWAATCTTALEVLARAQSLCEALLSLARADGERPDPGSGSRTEVGPLLAALAARAVAKHGGNARRLRVACEPNVIALSDHATLSAIIGNLLDNALRHGAATADSPVTMSSARENGHIRIDVANPAPLLTPDDLPQLFEPFWRKDASRANRDGFGLGLPIARALARACGGDLTADLVTTGKVRLSLSIPATT